MALTVIERRRVEEAVKTLAHYNKSPFITDFLKQQPKPRISPSKYEKAELCDLIKQVLLGEYRGRKKYVLRLDELITHLDRLQETGRQHIYLFRLPEERRDKLLASLRDLNEVKALLGGEEDSYKGGRLIWEARDGPQLALVRHDPASNSAQLGSLLLKWVETRTFWAPQEQPAGPSEFGEPSEEDEDLQEAGETEEAEAEGESQKEQIRPGRDLVLREERATSFFVINLDNGDCELRIQALHGRARLARQQQLATYRILVANLFGFDPVGPTVLAPAIRRALIAPEVPIISCVAILPDGGRFIGGKGDFPPVDVRKLQAGVAIRFIWPQPSGGIIRVELDGRLDEILTLRPLLPDQHRLLLEQVRLWRQEGLALFTLPKEPKSVKSAFQLGEEATETDTSLLSGKKSIIEILRVALVSRVPPEPLAEPGIDRATREYARTHTVEGQNSTGTTPDNEAKSAGATPLPTTSAAADEWPIKQFLGYIRDVAQNEHMTFEREIKLVRNEEKRASLLYIIAATLALTTFTIGAVLVLFFPAKLIGTITSLLGLLTGHGTVLIRSYAKSLEKKRNLIQEQQRDSQQTLMAIQTALSIPDQKVRSRAMTKVASSLLGRVTGLAPSFKQAGE
jgi:hypothetical protein